MADGHSAGVLSGAEFKAAETKLREERRREAAAMDPSESGAHAATVYRDRRTGKAINLADEAARIEAEREKKAQEAREQFEWGRGTKQKEAEASAREELKAVANEPFARRADDPKLEKMRRDVIRDGDPMADYIRQSRAQEEEKATPSESRRPVYKGPPPPPNRFGIRPGYRWDGVDRGNGWEQKLQNHAAQQVGLRNDRYAWSCADM
jgi:pre-mRNA-splicing factor CWC26